MTGQVCCPSVAVTVAPTSGAPSADTVPRSVPPALAIVTASSVGLSIGKVTGTVGRRTRRG